MRHWLLSCLTNIKSFRSYHNCHSFVRNLNSLIIITFFQITYTVGNPYIFTKYFVKMSGRYALLLFSLVYLAGVVAAVYQLIIGTSKKAFPRWLSGWLSTRKMVGLIALYFTMQHAIVTCLLLLPTGLYDGGPKGTNTKMNRCVGMRWECDIYHEKVY